MALFDRPCHTVSEILDLLLVTGTPACRAACRYVVYPVVQNVFFAHRREGADIIFSPVVRRRYCCSYYHPEARHRRPQPVAQCNRSVVNRSSIQLTGESCVLALSTDVSRASHRSTRQSLRLSAGDAGTRRTDWTTKCRLISVERGQR